MGSRTVLVLDRPLYWARKASASLPQPAWVIVEQGWVTGRERGRWPPFSPKASMKVAPRRAGLPRPASKSSVTTAMPPRVTIVGTGSSVGLATPPEAAASVKDPSTRVQRGPVGMVGRGSRTLLERDG